MTDKQNWNCKKIWDFVNRPLSVSIITIGIIIGLYFIFGHKDVVECDLFVTLDENIMTTKYDWDRFTVREYNRNYGDDFHRKFSFSSYQEAYAFKQLIPEFYADVDYVKIVFICNTEVTLIKPNINDIISQI